MVCYKFANDDVCKVLKKTKETKNEFYMQKNLEKPMTETIIEFFYY